MLSGPSFRSAFIFSINSLILSGFPLTSFHLAEALLSAFLWLYTLVCAKISRHVFYLQLFTFFVHILQSTCCFFWFFLHNLNTSRNYGTTTAPCIRRKEIKTKTKPIHVTFKLTTRSTVRFSPYKIQWFRERMASLSDEYLAQQDVWS